jgi:hypothetical protein
MAKLYTVTLTLKNGVPPTFDFSPAPEVDPGKATIRWVPGPSSAKFTFAALAFDHPNPFSNVVVKDAGITADDDNHHREEHKYSVLVEVNGTYYNSKDAPWPVPGGPTIKNN